MTWDIFIHTHGGHFKFWSAEKFFRDNGWVYSGQVEYGRIGSNGVTHFYDSDRAVRLKIRQKINEGYSIFATNQSNGTPLERLVRQQIGRQTQETSEPEPEPTPVQRVNERLSRTRTPIIKTYETTKTGNIKKYEYTRPTISGEENLEIKHEYVRNITGNQASLNKFMQYFLSIPLDQRNNIREMGSLNERGTIRDIQGETFLVFYSDNKIVGVFSIHTRYGISSVFYVKSTQNGKKQIVKHMLKLLSTLVTASNITIKNKPKVVEDEFEAILGTKTVRDMSVSEINRKVTGYDSNNIQRFVNKW